MSCVKDFSAANGQRRIDADRAAATGEARERRIVESYRRRSDRAGVTDPAAAFVAKHSSGTDAVDASLVADAMTGRISTQNKSHCEDDVSDQEGRRATDQPGMSAGCAPAAALHGVGRKRHPYGMVESRRFGRFTVVGPIAATTHSRVWEAIGPDGEHVAVKELKTHRLDAEPYRRFRDEVAFHTAGPHPGVLPVLGAHVPAAPSGEDPAWLAMPIAETVRAALGTGPALDEVVQAVHVYAATLARLAEGGVHHRDLKPDNLFRHEDQWVVGDFGLVTWPGKQALTEPGQKLGPAHFVALEMVDDPAGADAGLADVWSLAKVLWVLASGQNYPPPGGR